MVVREFTGRAPTRRLCHLVDVAASTFYYPAHPGPRGLRPSTHTRTKEGTSVPNEEVVGRIREELSDPFATGGYHVMTHQLRRAGYVINPKKVYRLMNEASLLLEKMIRTTGKRRFVQFRRITARYSLEYLCVDIKYIYVAGAGRSYLFCGIMDVYSRKILRYAFQAHIRQEDIIDLFSWLERSYGLAGVIIRNDNGSQFIANKVRTYLKTMKAVQEFTHIATPEENAYIEAFHSILQGTVVDRFELVDYVHAKLTIDAFIVYYNTRRLHGRIGYCTPEEQWARGLACSPYGQHNQAVLEGLSRSSAERRVSDGEADAVYNLDKPQRTADLAPDGEHAKPERSLKRAKPFLKSVQRIGG